MVVMSKNAKNHIILDSLFNSKARVKILKFLFRNNPAFFGPRELSNMIQESPKTIKKELKVLETIGLLVRK